MKKQILQHTKVIILGLVLAIGIMYISALAGPTQTPPAGNVDSVVNVGTGHQVKNGDLSVGNMTTTGALVALKDSLFAQKLYIGSSGVPSSSSTVSVDGVPGTISSSSLAGSGERAVCVDENGILEICNASTTDECGTANGQLFLTKPTYNLCKTGDVPAVVGVGTDNSPWSWSCGTSSCSAKKGFQITITRLPGGTGAGFVTSNPVGLNCEVDSSQASGECQKIFKMDTDVVLNAAPNGISYMTNGGFSGGCTQLNNNCTYDNISKNETVAVQFKKYPKLHIDATNPNTFVGKIVGTAGTYSFNCIINSSNQECIEYIKPGSSVHLVPMFNFSPPSYIGSWYGSWGGACSGSGTGTYQPPCDLIMNTDKEVTIR